jgi:hypothetical protein
LIEKYEKRLLGSSSSFSSQNLTEEDEKSEKKYPPSPRTTSISIKSLTP